jgi:hypothetical protein
MKLQTILKDILQERISPKEAYEDVSAIQTVIDNKRDLGFITLVGSTVPAKTFWELVTLHDLGVLEVPSNPHKAFIYYRKPARDRAIQLRNIAEKYGGYLHHQASAEDTRKIGDLLGYHPEEVEKYINTDIT